MADKSYGDILREYNNHSLLNHKHMMPPTAHVSVSDNPLDKGVTMFRRSTKKVERWIRESDERTAKLNRSIRSVVLKEIELEISNDVDMVNA